MINILTTYINIDQRKARNYSPKDQNHL